MKYKTIQVVKIGAGCLINHGRINRIFLECIAEDVSHFMEDQVHSVLVVSGAIRLGMVQLGYEKQPADDDIQALQRCACVGQPLLVQAYAMPFRRRNITTSQLLVTYHNLGCPAEEKNIEERVIDDAAHDIVTLVNYNDGIDSRGIALYDAQGNLRTRDNDMIAATIARYLKAKRLVILTNPTVNGTMGGAETKKGAIEIVKKAGIDIIIGDYRKGLYNLVTNQNV